MPKSKIRNRNHPPMHYNPFGNVVMGDQKKILYGTKARPVPGSTHRITKLSPYMGSRITPENRRKYEKTQAEAFKQRYVSEVVSKRELIEKQEDKTEEEIHNEITQFNSEQISEMELEDMARRFARYQSLKENKHYKAWLKGKSKFTYKGQTFPVLTERFLKQTKSIKDIVKVEENES